MPGFAAIGVAVGLSGIGSVIGGIAISAAVGAAIGGLSAAVMGGDIGKGMLFGAVGGVVTGGIAGGSIVSGLGMGPSAGLQVTGPTGAVGTLTGGGPGASLAAAEAVATGGGPGGGAVFGGAINATKNAGFMSTMFQGTGGDLMKGVGAMFMGGEDQDPRLTEAWREDEQAHAREMAKLQSSLRGGGGSGGGHAPNYTREVAKINAAAAMERLAHETAAHTSDIKLQAKEGRESTKQEYSLMTEKERAAHQRDWDKQKAAAATAGEQKYVSGEGAYEDVLAAQKERGQQQTYDRPGDAALQGPLPEEQVV